MLGLIFTIFYKISGDHSFSEPKSIVLRNTGSITGNWIINVQEKMSNSPNVPFQVSCHRVEIHPGGEKQLNILYTGPQDVPCEGYVGFF